MPPRTRRRRRPGRGRRRVLRRPSTRPRARRRRGRHEPCAVDGDAAVASPAPRCSPASSAGPGCAVVAGPLRPSSGWSAVPRARRSAPPAPSRSTWSRPGCSPACRADAPRRRRAGGRRHAEHELISPRLLRQPAPRLPVAARSRPGARARGRPPRGRAASLLATPRVVLRRRRAGHRRRRAGPRALRAARLRAPADHPQHPRRRRPDARGARCSSTSSTRCRPGGRVVLRRPRRRARRARGGRATAACRRSTPPARSWPRCTPRCGASPPRLPGRADRPRRPRGGRGHHRRGPGAIRRDRRRPTTSTSVEVADPERVAYLTQTTLAVDEVADDRRPRCAHRFPQPSTARRATTSATPRRTARTPSGRSPRECDLVLVVGSPNSSNSNRLVEVVRAGRLRGPPGRRRQRARPGLARRRRHRRDHRRRVGPRGDGRSGVVDRARRLGPVEVDERARSSIEDVRFALPAEVR